MFMLSNFHRCKAVISLFENDGKFLAKKQKNRDKMPKQIIPKFLIFLIPDVVGIRCGFCGSNDEFGCNSIKFGFVRS